MGKERRGILGLILTARKAIACVVIALVGPFLTGCYGRFVLTKAVYRANGAIRNSVLRNVVFWAFVIVPVYGVSMFADAVVFNLIEFWFGRTIRITSATDEFGNTVVLKPSQDGLGAVLTVSREGKVLREARFVRISETTCEVYDTDGQLVGRALRSPDGAIELTDADGAIVSCLSAQEIREAAGQLASFGRNEAR